ATRASTTATLDAARACADAAKHDEEGKRSRESGQHYVARSSVYSPGLAIVTGLLPPSENIFVSSYLPNFVTGFVPPTAGNPSAPAFTPIAFIRLQKYLLIGIVAVVGGVPSESSLLPGDCPPMQSESLLPWLMSVAPFSTL